MVFREPTVGKTSSLSLFNGERTSSGAATWVASGHTQTTQPPPALAIAAPEDRRSPLKAYQPVSILCSETGWKPVLRRQACAPSISPHRFPLSKSQLHRR